MTEWRIIPDCPDYEVSCDGRVRRATTSGIHGQFLAGTEKKIHVNPNGYRAVNLFFRGKHKRKLLHRLVCAAFHGPPPTWRHQAAHRDGNKSINTKKNLRWVLPIENAADRDAHGKTARGERCGASKLSDASIKKIRLLALSGICRTNMAAEFRVSPSLIGLIVRRKIWKHLR